MNISTNEVVLGARLASDLFAVSEAVRSGLELGAVIVGIPAVPASESKEIAVRATPETLAEMAVRPLGNVVVLMWASGKVLNSIERTPLGDARAWLVEQIRNAYDAGHAAGLDDLSRITAPTGTPLDELADLRREVDRLKEEAATAAKVKETDEAWVRTETLVTVASVLGIVDSNSDDTAIQAIGAFADAKRAEIARLKEELKTERDGRRIAQDWHSRHIAGIGAAFGMLTTSDDIDDMFDIIVDRIKDELSEVARLTRERDDARLDAERMAAEVTRLRTAAVEDKSPGSSYFSGFLEARLRVREYLEARESRLASAKKEAERLREESANAASRVMALTYECTALDEALDAIGEEPA